MSKPYIYRVVAALAVLITAVLTSANVPAVAQRGWVSAVFGPPNGGYLTFTFIGGNPACASYNGRDCLWGVRANQIDFRRVQPLVCGADHRNKYGVTGYENPRHWCNQAQKIEVDY